MENREFYKWSQLKRELKREFLPPDLDFQLEIQTTNRVQARNEKFGDYFHDISKLFQSMTRPISDRRKFEIIWRNMRYDYKNAMVGKRIKSISQLKKYGRLIDENYWTRFHRSYENSYKPRTNNIEEISTSFQNISSFDKNSKSSMNKSQSTKNEPKGNPRTQEVCNKNKVKQTTNEEAMEGSSKSTLQQLLNQYKRPPIGTCYNCRENGHHYKECSQPSCKFCRICGFPAVLTKTCPNCPKNVENSA